MYAASTGSAAGAALLLQHGANGRRTDAEGLSALDYAHGAEARNVLLQAAHR